MAPVLGSEWNGLGEFIILDFYFYFLSCTKFWFDKMKEKPIY